MLKEKSILGEYAINKLFEWLFSRVLATYRDSVRPGSIPGRNMSVLGPLVYRDRDDLGQVSSTHNVHGRIR